MSRSTLLITGCNGLIGEALTRRLGSDFYVIGADISDPPEDNPLTEFRHVDLSSDASVQQTVDHIRDHHEGALASVIHLAAYYDFSGEPSPLYDEITVQGTRRLLDALQPLDVGQFVFCSTMLVHAPVKPGECIDEDSPLEAKWAYPESKLKTENVIREHRGDIPVVLLRLAGVYTDYGKQPTLVHQIQRIYTQDLESFFFPGDVEAGQSLVHLDDTVDAIARAVKRRDELGPETPILVGEPDPPSYAALQDRIGELIWDREWPSIRLPEGVAKAGAWLEARTPGKEPFIKPFMIELADDHYGLDIGRAEKLLGWTPRHDVVDVLPSMVESLRDDPASWYEKNGLEVPDRIAEYAGSDS